MTVRMALVAAAALMAALVPTGAAEQDLASPAACLDAAASPPCGYIVPQISLEFPNKPPCRAETLGGPVDLSGCIPLPAVGASHVEEGLLRFSWDITQDGTYPPDATCAPPGTPCIVISFSGTATNPKSVKLTIEPAEVIVEAVDFAHPDNLRINLETQQVVFMIEVPLKVTFERTDVGADDKAVQRVERAQGVTQIFVKAKSTANGQYYKEAFGVEEFRFNTCANDDALRAAVNQCSSQPLADGTTPPQNGKDSPGVGVLGAFGVLAALAIALRRRRD
ncbi:MAG: hypothetical protein AABY18_08045 [Candidatus Thermoplasmatota archaeon]